MPAIEHDLRIPAPTGSREVGGSILVAVEPDAGTGQLRELQGGRDEFNGASQNPIYIHLDFQRDLKWNTGN